MMIKRIWAVVLKQFQQEKETVLLEQTEISSEDSVGDRDRNDSPAERLYIELSEQDFRKYCNYRKSSLEEGMWEVLQSIGGWWKPRYLINDHIRCAYEIMDESETFVHFTADDIDWDSLQSLPECAIERAKSLSANFPTHIRSFNDGVAEVSWQLNPDGRYYMDDDGYGMTSDRKIEVYGYVDTRLNVLVKFQYINCDWERLDWMDFKAREINKSNHLAENPQNVTGQNSFFDLFCRLGSKPSIDVCRG